MRKSFESIRYPAVVVTTGHSGLSLTNNRTDKILQRQAFHKSRVLNSEQSDFLTMAHADTGKRLGLSMQVLIGQEVEGRILSFIFFGQGEKEPNANR